MLLWVLFLGLLFAGSIFTAPLFPGQGKRLAYGITGTVAALAATLAVLRWSKDRWADAGLRWSRYSVPRFLGGLLLGLALLAAVLPLIYISTGIYPALHPDAGARLLLPLAVFFPLALMEEIAFRGYPFTLLQRRYGLWAAQGITAAAFALYHIVTGWPVLGSLLGPGTWAFVFGIAAARTGGLAWPTGIHTGLNVGQAVVGLGMAATGPSFFQLRAPDGSTGAALAAAMMPAGLCAQVIFLSAALGLTLRLARRRAATSPPAQQAATPLAAAPR
ncbi:hypothetical protein GCM10023184_02570 [Flaviaesturariibacter amylovorans]|uniref:CAAX prenyl protease 2/Lysostaphin resistance protein A-like domain-containing protein n=1 Tax=Flaviaesturariibacter amylovorans TaxID=1084520 RepID=A0ABP8G756_9BACT